MNSQSGALKNPLLEYAEKAFYELNPDAVNNAVQHDPNNAQIEAMMKSPMTRSTLHGAVQEKNFSIYFHGSLDDFEKNPVQTTWHARGLVGSKNIEANAKSQINASVNKGVESVSSSNPGEYITLQDGSLGRLVLRKATVTAVQNTSSLPVGLTFSNLPSNVEVFSGQGQANPFHVVIPPNVNSPFPQNQRIFYDHFVNNDNTYVQGLLWDQPRRSTLTKSSIEDSIISRPNELSNTPAWKVKIGSPLYQKAQEITDNQNDTSGTTMFNIPDTKNGTQGVAVVANSLAEKAYSDLHAELESLPFHNPHSIGAEITRVDRRSWTDPTYSVNEFGHDYGQDKNLKNPLFTRNKESIGAMLTVEYEVCKVEDAPRFDD